ncbi:MAG: neutral/alkaline non-lysosomal ceramidase N-terminal domain-containing protein, partial [Cephaloticoccus sp.]
MKAGFGKADITPRLGVQLAGYGPYRNRAAQEIVTPLYARALVVEQGRKRAVLLSLELGGTPRGLAERIRAAVAARLGGKAADVMVSATHTHSSPAVGGMYAWGEADMLYLETLPARAAAARLVQRSPASGT